MSALPMRRAPAWMRQDEALRQEIAPAREYFRQRLPALFRHVMPDRIAADQEGQSDIGEIGPQFRVPQRRAFRPRRQIPSARVAAGKQNPPPQNGAPPLVGQPPAPEPEP